MYTLDFTVSDWHEGLVANLDNPKIYGINRENLSNQIRIYLDLEENVSYTLDFKSAGSKWFRLMAKGDGYLFYTLQAEDMKRRNFNIQLVATYADGQVKKTPIYKGYDILQSINATDSANDKDASSFKEALMELAKWTKGDKGDKGEQGPKGDKGDKGDTPVKGVDYFTEAEIAEIEAEAKADVDSLVTAEAETREKADTALQSYVNGAIATEVQNRTTADSELSSKLTAETESREKADAELLTQISSIPKFSIEVVEVLPTTDISDTTVYLVKTSEIETGNLYTEYIHVNGAWEKLGTQTVDLSDYYQKEETQELLAEKAEKVHSHVVADISDYEPYDDTEVRGLISAESTARAEADAKKVGYQEVQGNTLYMYSDDSKAVLLATLELPTAPVQDVQVAGASIVADGVANLSSVQQSYVDGIVCSTDKELTFQQKINAKSRIGIQHLQLIETITIKDETTSAVSRSAEPSGDPYEFAEFCVKWYFPQGTSTQNVRGTFKFAGAGLKTLGIGSAVSTAGERWSGLYWDGITYGRYSTSTNDMLLTRCERADTTSSGVTENDLVNGLTVQMYTSGTYFPKGTEFYIYGIRA